MKQIKSSLRAFSRSIKRIGSFAAALLLTMFASCSSDDPSPSPTPTPEEHEVEAVKAVLVLAEGHLHGTYGFHQNPEITGTKYMKKVQTMTLNNVSDSWVIADSSETKVFKVRTGIPGTLPTEGNAVYGLWIYYYDDKDSLVNAGFIENGGDSLHQHFFVPRDVTAAYGGSSEADDANVATLYDYVYADTNPWNKTHHYDNATFSTNPVGFKGYFRFNKPRKNFTVDVRLMHATSAAMKFVVSGAAAPFYAPTSQQLQTNHWEVSLPIPFVAYATQSEYMENEELDVTWEDLTDEDKLYLKSISEAYGITWQEALQDVYLIINGDVNPESGALWF